MRTFLLERQLLATPAACHLPGKLIIIKVIKFIGANVPDEKSVLRNEWPPPTTAKKRDGVDYQKANYQLLVLFWMRMRMHMRVCVCVHLTLHFKCKNLINEI